MLRDLPGVFGGRDARMGSADGRLPADRCFASGRRAGIRCRAVAAAANQGRRSGGQREHTRGPAPDARSGAQIWVDADARPNAIKDILFRAATVRRGRRDPGGQPVAARAGFALPRAGRCPPGLDVADSEIVRRVAAGDLVVTQDIPLAALVLEKGAWRWGHAARCTRDDSIGQRLSLRNFMEDLRAAGVDTSGPGHPACRDRQAFANALDRWLATRRRFEVPRALGVASSLPAKATPASAGSTRRSTIPAGSAAADRATSGAAPRALKPARPVHAHCTHAAHRRPARPSCRSRRDGCACRLRPRPVRSG